MTDIEKLAILAEQADSLLLMKEHISALEAQIARLQQPRALKTKEVAEILGVSQATVNNWLKQGRIPGIISRNGNRFPSDRIFDVAVQEAKKRSAAGGL